MIRSSIAGRLALIHQVSAILIIVAFATSAVVLTGQTLFRDETNSLRNAASRFADEFEREFALQRSIPIAARLLITNEPDSRIHFRLYSPEGEFLGSTALPGEEQDEGAEVADPLTNPSGVPAHWHEQRITSRSGVLIVASVDTGARQGILRRLTLVMLWIGLPLMILTYVITGQVTRRALRPLLDMSERVSAIPSAAPRQGIADLVGIQEIDRLTKAFNELLTRLDDHLLAERRFTAEASHELRTPLTALWGEIEMALADPDLGSAARQNLLMAANQAHQMQQLVEAMLLLRRAGDTGAGAQPGFEPVNLADLLRDAWPTLWRVHPDREGDAQLDAPDEIMVAGNSVLLASAIGNLLDNALKFTKPGDPIRVSLSNSGELARLIVDDSGPGVPEADRHRIFEPFFRGPEARANIHGFGLGLPILKRVILAHGGSVAVGESPGGGARFQLELPLWRPAAGA